MKFMAEVLLSIVLHPVAMILAWVNLLSRSDLNDLDKLLWFLVITFAWGIGPILYVVLGDGSLW